MIPIPHTFAENHDDDQTDSILAMISVFVVSVTFAIGYFQKRRSDRLQRTLEFMRTIDEEDGVIHKDNLQFGIWINDHKKFYYDRTNSDEKIIIFRMLDWYDLLSYSCLRGILDEEMVIIILGGRMRSAYNMLKDFISENRKNLPERRELYSPFEDFVTDHIKDRPV